MSALDDLRAEFAAKYAVKTPAPVLTIVPKIAFDVLHLEAKKRAEYAAQTPETKAIVKEWIKSGMVSGLRDVTFNTHLTGQ